MLVRSFLTRVLAFVLGVVFTISTLVGAAVGGLFWAYKNLKPISMVTQPDEGLGDLNDQSIEDLVMLLTSALENPDAYTIDRLQGEYGLDIESILSGIGVDNVDTKGENWEALLGISIFNIADGLDSFLSSIRVRALYNFLPSMLDKDLDMILSVEAQERLGDYNIWELINEREGTEELGLIAAIKPLKLGAFLPEYFTSIYDPVLHQYTYVLNEDSEKAQALPIIRVLGNVSLEVISTLMNSNDLAGDLMAELMGGSLSSIAKMPLEDILYDLVDTADGASNSLVNEYGSFFKFLNGVCLEDLLIPSEDGGYAFDKLAILNAISNVKVGYLLGLT